MREIHKHQLQAPMMGHSHTMAEKYFSSLYCRRLFLSTLILPHLLSCLDAERGVTLIHMVVDSFSLSAVQMGWTEGSPSWDSERRKWSSFTHLKIKHLTGSSACVTLPPCGPTLTRKHSHLPIEMQLCNRAALLRTHTHIHVKKCALSQYWV